MADITAIKLPNNNTYNFKDSRVAVPVPADAVFTDHTYESKSAASGGTAVSLVTTGEKYTWNNKSSLALGETSSTAYRGDRGKTAYDHSQTAHAREDATKTEASNTNGKIKINGTDTTVYTHPGSGTNPHGTTKSDVGLGNVGNFKAVSTVASQGLTDAEKANALANIGAARVLIDYVDIAVSAGTGDIAIISDQRITANHKVVGYNIVWGDQSKITSDVTVTTSAGRCVINGTCTAATTATFQLTIPD